MDSLTHDIAEQRAEAAFTKQSAVFDALYAGNTIIKYKRDRVRLHMLAHLQPGSHILEINAGTGDDAVFFAKQGHRVHATDISRGMQQTLNEKISDHHLSEFISTEICSYTALDHLKNKGPYDCIFSNFAGLNCTGELKKVLAQFDPLLSPGGLVTLVILPKFCLWETALLLKGKLKTATRRLFSAKGRKANIDGESFTCWYHSPRSVIGELKNKFQLLGIEGLCTMVPPSYIEDFAEKHPRAFSYLSKAEDRLKTKWPWKYIGDYYIISLRKK